VERCLAKQPTDRYQEASELAKDLRGVEAALFIPQPTLGAPVAGVADEVSPVTSEEPEIVHEPTWSKRNHWFAVATSLTIGALVSVAVFITTDSDPEASVELVIQTVEIRTTAVQTVVVTQLVTPTPVPDPFAVGRRITIDHVSSYSYVAISNCLSTGDNLRLGHGLTGEIVDSACSGKWLRVSFENGLTQWIPRADVSPV
jgi:hypothetical protein